MPLDVKKCLEVFKNHGKTPRPQQIDALEQIASVWDSTDVIAALGPVGLGKSWIFYAIQTVTQGHIITAQNALVDQYAGDFPMNILKGKARYSCEQQDTCADFFAMCKDYCRECPYKKAIGRAEDGEPTVFNAMSYMTALHRQLITAPKVLMIDEAHALPGFLRELNSISLRKKVCGFTAKDLKSPAAILEFLERSYRHMDKLVHDKRQAGDTQGLKDDQSVLEKLYLIKQAMSRDAGEFLVYTEQKKYRGVLEDVLTLQPKRVPKTVASRFRGQEKTILMSGTLLPHQIREMVGSKHYKFLEFGNPIPAQSRKIVVSSAAATVNKDTPPEDYVKQIHKIAARRPVTERGIIHATYSLAENMKPLLDSEVYLSHEKHDKGAALARFLRGDGRFLLASGLSEGIDLKGDIARINIICKLQFPYLGDPYVKYRMNPVNCKDGALWYLSEALTHLMQAAGRTTRGADDYSITYLLDPGIYRVVEKIKALTKGDKVLMQQYLPKGFLDALIL